MFIEKEIANAMTVQALLEAIGEEAIEFGQACYKKARKLRGESPTSTTFEEIEDEIGKEWGDLVAVMCTAEIKGLFPQVPEDHVQNKYKRWYDRLVEAGLIKSVKARK